MRGLRESEGGSLQVTVESEALEILESVSADTAGKPTGYIVTPVFKGNSLAFQPH